MSRDHDAVEGDINGYRATIKRLETELAQARAELDIQKHDCMNAEDALTSIINSHGYKLTADMAYRLADEYFKKCKGNRYGEMDDLMAELDALRARCEALLKALETYGNHDWDCNLYGAVRGSDAHEAGCNCGFDESLAAAAPSGGGGE